MKDAAVPFFGNAVAAVDAVEGQSVIPLSEVTLLPNIVPTVVLVVEDPP